MNHHPEWITRISAQRVEALREVADRRRLLAVAPPVADVAAWRLRIASLLRAAANRLAPVTPGTSRASRHASILTPGGSGPC